MSTRSITAIIRCDRCGHRTTVEVINMPLVRKWLRSRGWDCSTKRDYCPLCVGDKLVR